MSEPITFPVPTVLRAARLVEAGALIPDPNYAGVYTVCDNGQEYRTAYEVRANPDGTLRVPRATCTCHEGVAAWEHATCAHVAAALLPMLDTWEHVRAQLTRSHLRLITGGDHPEAVEGPPAPATGGASRYTRSRPLSADDTDDYERRSPDA